REMLDLGDIIKAPVRTLSLGQRMRCEIAASLLHTPKVLFLDEPTIGLDAVSKIAVREFVREQNREYGTTVILTTHDMQDIEALTERILLIGKGKILLDGSISELRRRYAAGRELCVEYSREAEMPDVPDGVRIRDSRAGRVIYDVDTSRINIGGAISALTDGCEIRDVSVSEPSIDDIVLKLYGEFFGEGKK
ncbi:MAG: ATP-binding cassette domain-containing protein, partial [Eubacteriales bacterium]